jgi:hypothetical protein
MRSSVARFEVERGRAAAQGMKVLELVREAISQSSLARHNQPHYMYTVNCKINYAPGYNDSDLCDSDLNPIIIAA